MSGEPKRVSQNCSSLVTLLDEIQEDINYSKKTISSERLSEKLGKRAGELEDTLEQHLVGSTHSQRVLKNSLDNLRKTLNMNMTSAIRDIVETFDSEIDKLDGDAESASDPGFIDTLVHFMSSLESSYRQYSRQQFEIQDLKQIIYILDSINTNPLSPLEESLIVKQLRVIISDQSVEGATLKSIQGDVARQIDQIGDLIQELRSYSRRRMPALVTGLLVGEALNECEASLKLQERRLQESKDELDRLDAEVARLDISLDLTHKYVADMELFNSKIRMFRQVELLLR